MKEKIYVFQWISDLGGADTRLKELLILLKNHFEITCIPNDDFRLKEKHNTDFLDKHGISYASFSSLPKKLNGYAYANCNFRIFSEKNRINFIKESGLKFLWSNDMMWHTPEELDAVKKNLVDIVLYTSTFHRSIMHKEIVSANSIQKTFIIENYFDADTWPFLERNKKDKVVFGKLSRDDFMKFSENFPVFYEQVTNDIDCEFSILGWSDKLHEKYRWHEFGSKWKFYSTNAIPTIEWLNGIDVFLYNCNHRFIENQSRAIIESQLSGAPVIAPNKWNFPNMIENNVSGFVWNNLEEACHQAKEMSSFSKRYEMGKKAHEICKEKWCNSQSYLKKWNLLIEAVNKRVEANV